MKNKNAGLLASALFLIAAAANAAGTAAKPEDFGTGNMADAVKAMDTDGDGVISKDEYMVYESGRYDKSVQVPTGNMTEAVKAERASKREAYLNQRGTAFGDYSKKSNGQVSSKDMVGYLQGPGNKQ